MKRLICVCLLLFCMPSFAAFAQQLPGEVQSVLDEAPITAQEFSGFSLLDFLEKGKEFLKTEIQKPIRLLLQTIGIALLGAVAFALVPDKQWQKPLEIVCLLALFLAGVSPAMQLVGRVCEIIAQWSRYLISFVPAFSGVLLSCGQASQATVYSGMFLTMATFSAQSICFVAMPLVQVYIALHTASGLSGVEGLDEACNLITRFVKWFLGGITLLFSTVLGLQSVLASNADGLLLKTGQFLLSSGVPVVGGVVSDAMSSVLSGLKVLKGTLGFAAIAVLAVDFVPILLQSIAFQLVYIFSAAASKALGLQKAGDILKGIGQAISLCISFLIFFFMLVVIATALMIVLGGS